MLTRRFDALPLPGEVLFSVVREVGAYQRFLPMCSRSHVLAARSRDEFDAELRINYRLFEEAYRSRVSCGLDQSLSPVLWVRSIATEGSVVKYLESLWRIHVEEVDRCSVDYSISFEFSSVIYNTVTHLLKDVIAARISNAMIEEASRQKHQKSPQDFRRVIRSIREQYGLPLEQSAGEDVRSSSRQVDSLPELAGVDSKSVDLKQLQYLAHKRRKSGP